VSAHNRDVDVLRHRIDNLMKAASRIRANAADLHDLGWERSVTDVERVAGGAPDRAPKAGSPRARRLFDQIDESIVRMEAEMIGYERVMMALFFAGSSNPEPSRGSMISRADFDLQVERQRRRGSNTRIVEQPQHPGRRTDGR